MYHSVLYAVCSVSYYVAGLNCALYVHLSCRERLQCSVSKGIILPCRPICGLILTVYQQLQVTTITIILTTKIMIVVITILIICS